MFPYACMHVSGLRAKPADYRFCYSELWSDDMLNFMWLIPINLNARSIRYKVREEDIHW